MHLEAGNEFVLTTGDYIGDEHKVAITYDTLYKDVKKGGKILIDDGLIELEIENIKNGDIFCRVLNGGELGERKGVHLPDKPPQSRKFDSLLTQTGAVLLLLLPKLKMQKAWKT